MSQTTFDTAADRRALEEGQRFSPRFDSAGLVTGIVTDAGDGTLLMVAHLNAEALTRPWPAAFTYRRLPKDSTVYDYACAENNRNPVTSDGRTLTLDPSGQVIDKLE